MTSPLRLLLAIGLILALSPAVAQATVGVTISADPLEDRAITFVGTGDVAGKKLFARVRPDGGVPCASVYKGEPAGLTLFFAVPIGTQEVKTIDDPGAYVICAYLQDSSSDATAASAATVPLNVRANAATVTIALPPAANPGAGIPVTFVGTTELGRELYAKSKPAGAGPCATSRSAEPSTDVIANGVSANGAFQIPRLTGSFNTPGQYVICAWIQENFSDAIAEAAGSAILNVIAPLPLMTDLSIAPVSFAARAIGPAITNNFPHTTISFRLNTSAKVRFSVGARRPGRRVGTSCRKPTRTLRRRKACSRFVAVAGSFSHDATAGSNYVNFSGRLNGRRLALGRYRLYASPSNTTGRGATLRQSFRIVRR